MSFFSDRMKFESAFHDWRRRHREGHTPANCPANVISFLTSEDGKKWKKHLLEEPQKNTEPFDEEAYEMGMRQAYISLLRTCIRNLSGEDVDKAKWLLERAEIIQQLKMICKDFGDTQWEDTDYLPDVLEKHLAKWLHGSK